MAKFAFNSHNAFIFIQFSNTVVGDTYNSLCEIHIS